MEYIYSAMVLYAAGKDITEDAVTAVLKAAGVDADAAKVKALTASLDGADIKEAIESAMEKLSDEYNRELIPTTQVFEIKY